MHIEWEDNMKGLIGLVFLGICVVVAAAIVAGAITFSEAVAFLWSVLIGIVVWVIVAILAILGFIFIILLVAAALD